MSGSAGSPLDDLHAVDWAGLQHAYGRATDVPGQLRALLSADAAERGQALWELYGNIYHQGSRFQASCHVIPFLAKMVDDAATPGRPAVAGLLRVAAIGDLDDTSLPFDPDRAFAGAENVTDADVAEVVAWLDDGENHDWPEMADEVPVAWERDCYRAAAAISDRFAAWTGDPDQMVAARAAELLAWFPATQLAVSPEYVVSRLLEIPGDEGYEVARGSANLTLRYLAPGDPAVESRLTGLLAASSFGVRVTAAVTLAFRLGDRLPDAGLQVLVEARDHASEIAGDAFPIPWDRSLPGFAALALHRIGLSP